MRIHKNIPKRILSLCLVFAIGISMGVLSDHFVSENSRFQTFTEKLFRSEVCSNTLTICKGCAGNYGYCKRSGI